MFYRPKNNDVLTTVKNPVRNDHVVPRDSNNYHFSKGSVESGFTRNTPADSNPVYGFNKSSNFRSNVRERRFLNHSPSAHNGNGSKFFEQNLKLHRNSVLQQSGIDMVSMNTKNTEHNKIASNLYNGHTLKNQQVFSSPNPVSKMPLLPKTSSPVYPYINVPPYINHLSPQRNYSKLGQLLDTAPSSYQSFVPPKYK